MPADSSSATTCPLPFRRNALLASARSVKTERPFARHSLTPIRSSEPGRRCHVDLKSCALAGNLSDSR